MTMQKEEMTQAKTGTASFFPFSYYAVKLTLHSSNADNAAGG